MPGLEAPTIEKIIMAVVMVICIIFLVIGIYLLIDQSYASGSVMTLLGLGGIGGVIYWIMHPMIAHKGADEDVYDGSPVREMCDCEGADEDGEEFEDMDVAGSHEGAMLADLESMVNILAKGGDMSQLKNMLQNAESTHNAAVKTTSDVVHLLDKTLEDKQKLREAYEKLDKENQTEITDIIDRWKDLSSHMSEQSKVIEKKLHELSHALKGLEA